MKNGDKPAYPAMDMNSDYGIDRLELRYEGLTKREVFCLHNAVPATGDHELDEIIRTGNRQKAAIAAMQGLVTGYAYAGMTQSFNPRKLAELSVEFANELLKRNETQTVGLNAELLEALKGARETIDWHLNHSTAWHDAHREEFFNRTANALSLIDQKIDKLFK